MQQLTRALARIGGLTGPGVLKGTVSVNPASVGAGARGATVIAITGVSVGDLVYLEPPAALEAGLIPSGVVAGANQVTLYLTNPTAGAVDGTARNWDYTVLKVR